MAGCDYVLASTYRAIAERERWWADLLPRAGEVPYRKSAAVYTGIVSGLPTNQTELVQACASGPALASI